MCNKCYQPYCPGTCGCEDDCPIKLDFACIIYNKAGKDSSRLQGLNLPNGSTLRLVVETLDEKVKQLDVVNFNLPYLRSTHLVNGLKKFAEVVDSELAELRSDVTASSSSSSPNLIGVNSSSISFNTSGTQGHTITANVKVSAQDGNTLTIVGDGLFNNPQTLAVDYTTKNLTISNGNSVDLSPLVNTASGFLGNVPSDPTNSSNGNYWFNTSQNKLKIKVNNIVKEITTI